MKSLRTLVVAGWVFFGREGEEGESQGWFRKAGVGKSINLSSPSPSLPTITRPLFFSQMGLSTLEVVAQGSPVVFATLFRRESSRGEGTGPHSPGEGRSSTRSPSFPLPLFFPGSRRFSQQEKDNQGQPPLLVKLPRRSSSPLAISVRSIQDSKARDEFLFDEAFTVMKSFLEIATKSVIISTLFPILLE